MKSDEEYQKTLSPEAYRVLRQRGTEAPFSGQYYYHREKGVYVCAACGNPLFRSEAKFDAGCGWPSFFEPVPGGIATAIDRGHGMIRTEVQCAVAAATSGMSLTTGRSRPDSAIALTPWRLISAENNGSGHSFT